MLDNYENALRELKAIVKDLNNFYEQSITARAFVCYIVSSLLLYEDQIFYWCYDDTAKDGVLNAVNKTFKAYEIMCDKEKLEKYNQKGSLNVNDPVPLSSLPKAITVLMDLFEELTYGEFVPNINQKISPKLKTDLQKMLIGSAQVLNASKEEKEDLSHTLSELLKDICDVDF